MYGGHGSRDAWDNVLRGVIPVQPTSEEAFISHFYCDGQCTMYSVNKNAGISVGILHCLFRLYKMEIRSEVFILPRIRNKDVVLLFVLPFYGEPFLKACPKLIKVLR